MAPQRDAIQHSSFVVGLAPLAGAAPQVTSSTPNEAAHKARETDGSLRALFLLRPSAGAQIWETPPLSSTNVWLLIAAALAQTG